MLLDPESPAYLIPLGGFLEAIGRVHARTGGGLPLRQRACPTPTTPCSTPRAGSTEPAFTGQLVQEWLPLVPDLDARLRAGGDRRRVRLRRGVGRDRAGRRLPAGCASTRSTSTRPRSRPPRRNAEQAGVADRVRFAVADVTDPALTGSYDAVFAFEMVHDLADPVAALRTARRLTGDGAAPVIVMDERAARGVHRTSRSDGALLLRRQRAALPARRPLRRALRADRHRHAAGHPAPLRHRRPGSQVTVLPIENDMFRFYRIEG